MNNIVIYKITCLKNNKIYIGKSTNIHSRLKSHLNSLKRKEHINIKMQNDFNKFGESNFKFEIIKKNKT